MAEWLRRLPAKQFPFGSVGSNPAVVVFWISFYINDMICHIYGDDRIKKRWRCGVSIPVPLACKASALPSELHPHTNNKDEKGRGGRLDKNKKSKNSPTGIRTPVFHVTGEDTNQLYYWRLLNKSHRTVDVAKTEGKSTGLSIYLSQTESDIVIV